MQSFPQIFWMHSWLSLHMQYRDTEDWLYFNYSIFLKSSSFMGLLCVLKFSHYMGWICLIYLLFILVYNIAMFLNTNVLIFMKKNLFFSFIQDVSSFKILIFKNNSVFSNFYILYGSSISVWILLVMILLIIWSMQTIVKNRGDVYSQGTCQRGRTKPLHLDIIIVSAVRRAQSLFSKRKLISREIWQGFIQELTFKLDLKAF